MTDAASEAGNTPLTLYFFPTPNGFKITIMLAELALPYDLKVVDINEGDQFAPGFLAISPNNRIPAIVDPNGPDGAPVQIFESGAILMYLARKWGRFYPQGERARIEVEQWLFWQMGGLGPMAGQAHHFVHNAPEKIPYGIERYVKETGRLYWVMNKRLADRSYLAGDYSIADIACFPWARLWQRQQQDIEAFPHFKAWLDRVAQRPAVIEALSVTKEDGERPFADWKSRS